MGCCNSAVQQPGAMSCCDKGGGSTQQVANQDSGQSNVLTEFIRMLMETQKSRGSNTYQ
jgi:hypothetical protein